VHYYWASLHLGLQSLDVRPFGGRSAVREEWRRVTVTLRWVIQWLWNAMV